MLALENYDIQATRREAKAQGKAEGEAMGKLTVLTQAIKSLFTRGHAIPDIALILDITEDEVNDLLPKRA